MTDRLTNHRSVPATLSESIHSRVVRAAKLLGVSPSEALHRALDTGLKAICRASNCRCKHAKAKTLADLSKRGEL